MPRRGRGRDASRWRPPWWYDRLGGIAWRAVIVVVAVAMLVTGIVALSSVILPAALGLLFACGLHPISSRLISRNLPRSLAAGIAVLVLVLAIAVVVWVTIRAVVDQWGSITSLIGEGRATLQDTATDNGVAAATAGTIGDDIGKLVAGIAAMLTRGLVHLVPTVAGIVTTVLLSFLVAFFFLKDGASMWRWILARLGGSGHLAERVGGRVWDTLSGYIVGQALIALADASLITLGALVLGVPNAGAIFMLTLFGAFIPFIGAFVSGLLAVLLALGDSGMAGGVWMLVIVIVVQLLEGNVLQPWIQGKAVRLHPLVIALSVTAGGALAGFLGVFLAVPITAAGFVMLSELRRAGIIGPAPATASTDGGVGIDGVDVSPTDVDHVDGRAAHPDPVVEVPGE